MKILVYADPHWCETSSVVRGYNSDGISDRLNNLINSINWVYKLAQEHSCDMIVCLGDFFDKSSLSADEISCLTKIKNNSRIPMSFVVGNHEISKHTTSHSSAHIFSMWDNCYVYDTPTFEDDLNILYLPYICESDRLNLSQYCDKLNENTIIFSHNDIKGIQMGRFVSQTGFDIEDIVVNCGMFINGHLHNGSKVNNKIINLGNLTGQNFSEDAYTYSHNAMVLNTHTLEYELFENPYAFNFYKFDVNSILECKQKLSNIKNNAVISIKCSISIHTDIEELLNIPKVFQYRITVTNDEVFDIDAPVEINKVDYLKQFEDYVFENIGTDNIVKEELQEILI